MRSVRTRAIAIVIAITLATAPAVARAQPLVELLTNFGRIVVDLEQTLAPRTVANFLRYVDQGFYQGTVFHRVANLNPSGQNLIVQGGGYTTALVPKTTFAPIVNEADNGLSNLRGTIAMARTEAADSATSQFFFNLDDNTFLDYQDKNRPGYAVFGRVVVGLDVLDRIGALPTGALGPFSQDLPLQAVIVESARRLADRLFRNGFETGG